MKLVSCPAHGIRSQTPPSLAPCGTSQLLKNEPQAPVTRPVIRADPGGHYLLGLFTPEGPERLSEITQVSWCRTDTCSIKPTGAARVGAPGGAELYEGRMVPFTGSLHGGCTRGAKQARLLCRARHLADCPGPVCLKASILGSAQHPSHQFTCGQEAVAKSPRLRHLSCAPAAPAREGRGQLCVPSVPSSTSGLALGPACVCTSTQASTYIQAGRAHVCTCVCATLVPADVGELQ